MIRPLTPLILALVLLPGCGKEDPELVAKQEQQRAEIRRLEGELAVIREKIKSAPPDRGKDLEAMLAQTTKQEAEIAGLEAEIEVLEDRKRELEREFEAYRRKYVVR